MKFGRLIVPLAAGLLLQAAAPPLPSGPAGSRPIPLLQTGSDQTEVWTDLGPNKVLRNVTHPTLTPVLPNPANATGAAVIVAPGGAFMMLSMESEGWQVARWLADHGVAAFVLKYRLDPTPVPQSEFLSSLSRRMSGASGGERRDVQVIGPHPSTEDGLAAIKLVRSRAAEWHVDPRRVGIVGFSAGAMLALRVALTADPAARPDFAAPIYPPLSPVAVPTDAPPVFVAIAANDPLFSKRGFGLIESWQKANRPIEFHMYEKGGHGFGMNKMNGTSDLWIDQFYAWMKGRGLLASAPIAAQKR